MRRQKKTIFSRKWATVENCTEFPDEWKNAKVIPIFKGGIENTDRSLAANDPSHSHHASPGQWNLKIVNAPDLPQDKHISVPTPTGWISTNSFNRYTTDVPSPQMRQMALDIGESIESIFLDLRKAYDRVSHQGLISKLSTCGFSYLSLKWMFNFLSHRKQCVRLSGTDSPWMEKRSGISQGAVWGRCFISSIHQWSTYSTWK